MSTPSDTPDGARREAVQRLQAKRAFSGTAVTFTLIGVLLVIIWLVSGDGFFWPIFPIAGMGIALAMQAWNLYGRRPITEEEIRREMARGEEPPPS